VNLLEDASLNARKDATELTELVYTADSELRRPVQMLRSMYLDLLRSRGLAWRLFLRDLNGQYRQSLLGYLWLLLPPLGSRPSWETRSMAFSLEERCAFTPGRCNRPSRETPDLCRSGEVFRQPGAGLVGIGVATGAIQSGARS